MPSVRPILLPAKKVPTAKARCFLSNVSRITREPDGIMTDSPTPTRARNTRSGANNRVRLQSAVASDQNTDPHQIGAPRANHYRPADPAANSEKVNAQLNAGEKNADLSRKCSRRTLMRCGPTTAKLTRSI